MTSPLIIYIREQLAAGFQSDAIWRSLLSNGWTERELAEAFIDAKKEPRALADLNHPTPLTSGKIPLAITLAIVSSAYATWLALGGGSAAASIAAATTTPGLAAIVSAQPISTSTALAATSSATQKPADSEPQPADPIPEPKKPSGLYADGAYTGTTADAFYGVVQVEAIIQDGKLADVKFLQYPTDRPASRLINDEATPLLAREAIAIQNANVDTASGATFTSEAFRESLASALVLAKN